MIEKAINYVLDNIDDLDVRNALRYQHFRMPVDRDFVYKVFDLLEEFGQDNDLNEEWYYKEYEDDQLIDMVIDTYIENHSNVEK